LAKVTLGQDEADSLRSDGLLDHVHDVACLLIAAEQSGITRAVMQMSIEYAKTRHQFDKPIGVYQGVSHKIVDMYTGAEHATSLLYKAAWAAHDAPSEAGLSAWTAKAWADEAAFTATASAIQVHGGIGFTWEHDLHLFYKRARSNRVLFEGPGSLKQRISQHVHGPREVRVD
ncbi:MAG: acyl-CoA dehydrogenase family protein, partial [Actinomycetota bacterium]